MPGEADTGSRITGKVAGAGAGAGDGVCPTAPTVAAFFRGKTVLVTGATGFIGKVLIEKLIRCCPDITRIYLLIRAKRGMTAEERLQDLVKGQVFDQIRKLGLTDRLGRLTAVMGDVSEEGLSVDEATRRALAAAVNVVFHCAANVRFDMSLRDAVSFNTIGTKRVLQFASTITNLQAFIHVGTSYCHCQEEILEERMYPPHADPQRVMDALQWMDDDMLRDITPKLIHPLPNTYAFSKSLSEALVTEFGTRNPVGIARPSIVMPSWMEPLPGWVDNLNGPSGLLVGAAKGVIRSIHCKGDYLADLVPVDLVVNSVIALAWKVGTSKPDKAIIINVTESGDNPMSWGDVLEISKKYARVTPSEGAVWYPDGSMKDVWWQHALCVVFFHFIPAYLIDLLLFMTGHRTFMVRLQHRIQGGLAVLYYYTTKNWIFKNGKMKALSLELSPEDQQTYFMDIRAVNWNDYFKNYVFGIRHYVLHEDPDATKAVKHHQRLYVLHRITVTLFYVLVGWMLYHFALWATSQVGHLSVRTSSLLPTTHSMLD